MQGGPATVHGLLPLSETTYKYSRSQGAADGWPRAAPAFQRLQRTPHGARAGESLSGMGEGSQGGECTNELPSISTLSVCTMTEGTYPHPLDAFLKHYFSSYHSLQSYYKVPEMLINMT